MARIILLPGPMTVHSKNPRCFFLFWEWAPVWTFARSIKSSLCPAEPSQYEPRTLHMCVKLMEFPARKNRASAKFNTSGFHPSTAFQRKWYLLGTMSEFLLNCPQVRLCCVVKSVWVLTEFTKWRSPPWIFI